VSYKIEIAGGSVIVVQAADVDRVTKEDKTPASGGEGREALHTQDEYMGRHRSHGSNTDSGVKGYKDKGGFFEAQIAAMYGGAGVKLMGGYKISQFAMIGLGVGVIGIYNAANTHSIGGDPTPYSGQYFPFFLHYSGDILKRNVTPFYELNAGYTFVSNLAMNYFNGDPSYNGGVVNITRGGPMGSAAFGVRMYIGRRFTLTVSADLAIQYAHTEVDNYPGSGGYYYLPTSTYSHAALLLPGIKVGLGIVK
jgi:hypothetical protein